MTFFQTHITAFARQQMRENIIRQIQDLVGKDAPEKQASLWSEYDKIGNACNGSTRKAVA